MALPVTLERGRFKVCWWLPEPAGKHWRFCCHFQTPNEWRRLPLSEYDTDLSADTAVELDLLRLGLRILEILQEHGADWTSAPNEYAELTYADPLRLVSHVSLDCLSEYDSAAWDWPQNAIESVANFSKPKQPGSKPARSD